MPTPPANSNPFAPPASRVVDAAPGHPGAAPALWNPNAAANWSLLFTPLFGALLQMKNWMALDEPEKAAASKRWAIVTCIYLIVDTGLTVWQPGSPDVTALRRSGGLGLLIAWYFASARGQARYVKARFGDGYPRKRWRLPILYALLGYLGLFAMAAIIGR
jgi:hypothetical protein